MSPNYINHFFILSTENVTIINNMNVNFGFNGLGEAVYYRTYSRIDENGNQEHWCDTVVRVTNGIFSIRKNHYVNNRLAWNDDHYQDYALDFAKSMFNMYFLPPGRGLWACGTRYVAERGSAPLYNCAYFCTKDLVEGATWAMDFLMCGVGVGFDTKWEGEASFPPSETYEFIIPDSREGWCDALKLLLESFCPVKEYTPLSGSVLVPIEKRGLLPIFNTSLIRKKGTTIHGFGGLASGPDPLIEMLYRVKMYLTTYIKYRETQDGKYIKDMIKDIHEFMIKNKFETHINGTEIADKMTDEQMKSLTYDKTRCVTDIINCIGRCVVAGNVRRSAEIALGSPTDETFLNLKNWNKYPERGDISHLSNNTCMFEKTEDFNMIPNIAERIKLNGEPGFCNLMNINRFGRVRDNSREIWTREHEKDEATGCNPCSEIPLESFETCNLAETMAPRCVDSNGMFDEELFYKSLEFSTFYCSTVSLLPTHQPKTNAVIARNRRIGVSISGIAETYTELGFTTMTRVFRKGYKIVSETNRRLAREAGICESIRKTTIKPSGTISLLAGVSPGMHFPTFRYAVRRVTVAKNAPINKILIENKVPYEQSHWDSSSNVFEFSIDQGKTRAATEVSIWEQFQLLTTLQREYADNMVSVTIYFNPKTEHDQIEYALAQNAPLIKSCSLLPHADVSMYKQAPYTGITKDEYTERIKRVKLIDWSAFGGSDGQMERYCTNETCLF